MSPEEAAELRRASMLRGGNEVSPSAATWCARSQEECFPDDVGLDDAEIDVAVAGFGRMIADLARNVVASSRRAGDRFRSMNRALGWVVVMAVAAGCKEKETAAGLHAVADPKPFPATSPKPGSPVQRGTLHRTEFVVYGVIAPPGADTEKLAAVARATRDVVVKEETPSGAGWNAAHADYYGKDYPPEDRPEIEKSTFALSIVANGPDAGRRAAAAAIAVARACHGWIVDLHQHHLYTADTIADHVESATPRDVRKLIVVHQVAGGGDLTFLDTAGMERFGLPELFLADVPTAHVPGTTTLMNATAQTLLERGDLTRDGELDVDATKLTGDWHVDERKQLGGIGKITWKVTWSRGDAEPGEELDPDQPVLQLSLPGTKPGSAEALLAALDTFEGAVEDKVRHFDYRDELDAAGVKARAALTQLRPHFAKAVPAGEELAVKAPFTTDSGNIEWMWVDVVSIKGATVDGILDNDPDEVSSLKIGARVKVKFAELADFIHARADGTKVGGYSLEVMRAHGEDVPPL